MSTLTLAPVATSRLVPSIADRNLLLLRQVRAQQGTWIGLDYDGNIVEADGVTVDTDDLSRISIETGNPSWWYCLTTRNAQGMGLTKEGLNDLEETLGFVN